MGLQALLNSLLNLDEGVAEPYQLDAFPFDCAMADKLFHQFIRASLATFSKSGKVIGKSSGMETPL